ncbi:hypothetical protein P171DRAFT_141926 [Karstenula rhodostoma CBS 690.94]|uniref:Secreted protein n=1 Tax=Karstenula rhodostoma CBS 690.94 TaxID=1392251 RepID=A0A9P4PUK6_9PLEO|nr:hypothetical protein P171DRAFT_141926 [Karstenula rhodostoma CBS 690.94]
MARGRCRVRTAVHLFILYRAPSLLAASSDVENCLLAYHVVLSTRDLSWGIKIYVLGRGKNPRHPLSLSFTSGVVRDWEVVRDQGILKLRVERRIVDAR